MNNQSQSKSKSKFKKIEDAVRIGGKGSMRRKHKRVPASAAHEMKRLQTALNKLSLYQMAGIEQLTLSMDDQSELVIQMPKVQGSPASNLLVFTGKPTYVPAPAQEESEPLSPCPSPPPTTSPPPSPPSPPSFANTKPAKKPKKPRNRVRLRNKRVREMLLEDDGADAGGDSDDLGSADDLLSSRSYFQNGDGYDSDDSDKTKVPSDSSEMDQTIVGDDSPLEFDVGDSDERGSGSEETLERKFESEENGDRVLDNGDNFGEYVSEGEGLPMTLEDFLSWLEEN